MQILAKDLRPGDVIHVAPGRSETVEKVVRRGRKIHAFREPGPWLHTADGVIRRAGWGALYAPTDLVAVTRKASE